MEKLKFALFSIVTLALVGIFGYWAVVTIQSGSEYVSDQQIKELSQENEALKKEVQKQKNELSALVIKLAEPALVVPQEPEQKSEDPKTPKPTTVTNHQDLISELQKLVDAKVFLKEKSTGPRVGTIQKFLNVYFNTNIKVDNGYGGSTAKRVEDFQRAVGLSPDGEAGPGTISKMIEWLKQ